MLNVIFIIRRRRSASPHPRALRASTCENKRKKKSFAFAVRFARSSRFSSAMQRGRLALLICIWICFTLGIFCTLFTVRLKIQTESVLRALKVFHSQQRAAPESQGECLSAICRWQGDYLWGRLNDSVHPCHNFHDHVCSSAWFRDGKVADQPYTHFSIAQLMTDVRDSLSQRGVALPAQAAWSFPAQAAQLLRLCDRAAQASTTTIVGGWDVSVRNVLTSVGLDAWPYSEEPQPPWSPLGVLAALERDLGVSVLASVTLEKDLAQAEYQLHLGVPATLLRRFILHRRSSGSLADYEAHLGQVMASFATGRINATDNTTVDTLPPRLAADIVALEKRLEALQDLPPPPLERRFVRAGQLRSVSKWSWTTFLAGVLLKTRPVADNTTLVCDHCGFFDKVALLVEETPLRTLANYAGLRVLALLSPLIPAEEPWIDFLVRLHGRGLNGVSDRLESCLSLLERVYRYGTAMLARMALGRQFPTVYRSQYDRQLATLASSLTRAASHRAARLSFLKSEERRQAQSKLSSMGFQVLGTAPSLYWPALYYGVSSPLLTDADPIVTVQALLRHTRRSYLASRTPNLDLDAQYPLNVFGSPSSFYFPLRNLLFLPQSLISFLSHVSNSIDAPMIPVVGRPILNAALKAIDGADGKSVDHTLGVRSWWSVNSSARYDEILHCLLSQYARLYWPPGFSGVNWREHVDGQLLFRDVASVLPLFDSFKHDPASSNFKVRVSPGRVLEPAQLFFVNFALSLCEYSGHNTLVRLQSKLGILPAVVRINLAMINSPEFSRTFGCGVNNTLASQARCKIW